MENTGMKSGVVHQLEALSGYVPDAVVSRTLVKNDAGNITFFAFGVGQGLSKHSAPFDAFVQGLDGEAVVIIGEEEHTVKRGDVILMPANIPHEIRTKSDFKMLLVMLKG